MRQPSAPRSLSTRVPVGGSCGGTDVVALDVDLRYPHELVAILAAPLARSCRGDHGAAGESLTALVCTTSFNVMFIHVSHCTRWPFSVSPLLSSTSIGWPWAALNRPRGNWKTPYVSRALSVGARSPRCKDTHHPGLLARDSNWIAAVLRFVAGREGDVSACRA